MANGGKGDVAGEIEDVLDHLRSHDVDDPEGALGRAFAGLLFHGGRKP